MWSVGCIFAELLSKTPVFQADGNDDDCDEDDRLQLECILDVMGSPSSCENISEIERLPAKGRELLENLLIIDPEDRISAEETKIFFKKV